MKIAFFEVQDWEEEFLEYFKKEFKDNFFFTKEKLNSFNADNFKDFEIVSVFIYSNLNKECLEKLSSLKFIATRSTGFDHIDTKECKRRKIYVSNVPSYGEKSVAEFTFALILSFYKKILEATSRTKEGDFSINGLMSRDLNEKTLGILGTGKIGTHVAKIAKAFGMKVLAYDIKKNLKGVKYVSLNELLSKSDIISLHLPLNERTKHIINKENISIIKRGALIVNTARGGLIETRALLEGIEKEIISGALLDVLEEEPLIREESQIIDKDFNKKELSSLLFNHILLNKKNIFITPHCAFYSKEAIKKIEETTLINIKRFLAKKPVNLIR
ncbi:MAG: NAD(P)-dependent oxidoreductase [Candidatus Pacearchaeota archaeon]